MRHLFSCLCLLLIGCGDDTPAPTPPKPQPTSQVIAPGGRALVHVDEVVDGDTFWTTWNGVRKRVRLLGVDTPELEPNRKDRERFGAALKDDSFGRAREFLRNLVEDKDVELHFSVSGDQIDNTSSKRLLGYIHVGDTDVNAEICRQGYTYFYSRYEHDRREEFGGYVRQAQEQKRGLWE